MIAVRLFDQCMTPPPPACLGDPLGWAGGHSFYVCYLYDSCSVANWSISLSSVALEPLAWSSCTGRRTTDLVPSRFSL